MNKTPLEDWIARKIGLQAEELTREALERYQLAQIRKTIAWVKEKSSFYREKFRAVEPESITDFSLFSKLPFTFPQDIRQNPQRLVCTGQRDIARIVTLNSSGTTGQPKRIYFTPEDQQLTIDFFDIGMRNLVGPGDRVLILLPWRQPGSVGDLLRAGLERLGAEAILFGPVSEAKEAVQTALKSKANSLVGIPTHVLAMARSQKGKLLSGSLKSVLLSTDYVPRSICQALESIWGCQVFNHYGMTEMGLGGGVQCAALAGYHLREADLYFEIIDPESGQVLDEGETGEVVFTTLTRVGMPLIRYRTGDLSRFIPTKCLCGTVLRSMEVVKSRIAGQIKLQNHSLSIAEIDEVLFLFDEIVDYQARIDRDSGRDCLYIDIKTSENTLVSRDKDLEYRLGQALRRVPAIQKEFPLNNQIVIITSGNSVPFSRGTGKRSIIDNRLNSG
ncbi:MAG: phenylacetate--CoA ligase family protein [Peptococcaceae bacterium]|nr:phenylacetate--CoA ligase family protein [Peptococcaceae bacterium]